MRVEPLRLVRWLPVALMPLGLAACQTAPPVPSHAELVKRDLAELVAGQQPPCGAVRLYSRHGRLDYRVECDSGQAYRVHVGADGRVVVTALPPPAAAPAPAPR